MAAKGYDRGDPASVVNESAEDDQQGDRHHVEHCK